MMADSDEETRQQQSPDPATGEQATGPIQHCLLTAKAPMGAVMPSHVAAPGDGVHYMSVDAGLTHGRARAASGGSGLLTVLAS